MKIRKTLRCKKCGYQWTPKKDDVKCCPKCKSYTWNNNKNYA